ncbi:MAG: type II toxin-antitoxin system RelE/ParE family toxin [Asticcacaulis sp.]
MFGIELLPLAEEELDEAEVWYALRSSTLGEDFHIEVDKQLERIAHNPYLYGVVRRDIRRAPLRQFPHGIFFRVIKNMVVVVGVLHPSRRPSVLRDR